MREAYAEVLPKVDKAFLNELLERERRSDRLYLCTLSVHQTRDQRRRCEAIHHEKDYGGACNFRQRYAYVTNQIPHPSKC